MTYEFKYGEERRGAAILRHRMNGCLTFEQCRPLGRCFQPSSRRTRFVHLAAMIVSSPISRMLIEPVLLLDVDTTINAVRWLMKGNSRIRTRHYLVPSMDMCNR